MGPSLPRLHGGPRALAEVPRPRAVCGRREGCAVDGSEAPRRRRRAQCPPSEPQPRRSLQQRRQGRWRARRLRRRGASAPRPRPTTHDCSTPPRGQRLSTPLHSRKARTVHAGAFLDKPGAAADVRASATPPTATTRVPLAPSLKCTSDLATLDQASSHACRSNHTPNRCLVLIGASLGCVHRAANSMRVE